MQENKISLLAAVLINVNIILGAGIFLNVKPLTNIAGPFGFLGYIFGALILLPFVWSLAKLSQAHPVAGGLYTYSKEHLHPFIGFISGWSFFIGKTVSAAFLAYAFTNFIKARIPFIQNVSTLPLACITIFGLIFLNIAGAHIGGKIQYMFITIKAIPIFFVICFGVSLFQPHLFDIKELSILSGLSTIPIALYALMGFETTCAIGHMITNAKKNIFRAIIISFFIIVTIHTLFQIIFFGVLGNYLPIYTAPFHQFASIIFTEYPIFGRLLNAFIFTSVIAGSFGILTSNCWNFHTLVKDNHLPGKKLFGKIRQKTYVPWTSLLFEGIIACTMLIISKNQIALQSMAVFGVLTSFLLSSIAAKQAGKHHIITIHPIIPNLAIAGCSYALLLCLQKMFITGVSTSFLILLITGIGIALIKNRRLFFIK